MRRLLSAVFCVSLAGCMDESSFIAEYVEAECAYAVECYDQAILDFNSWDSEQACADDRGPVMTAEYAGCTIDRATARECLGAIRDLACPSEGEDPALPAICAQVWTCPEPSADTDAAASTNGEAAE